MNRTIIALYLLLSFTATSVAQNTITFDDQGLVNEQTLSNPYTIANGGESFRFTLSGGNPTSNRYRTTETHCGNSGLSHLYSGNVPQTTWTIETVSGNEIDLGTVRFDNIFTCYVFEYALTIEGFKDGVSSGSQSFTTSGLNSTFTSNSSFDAVDKIVITCSDLGNLGIDNINWILAPPSYISWDGSTSTDWNIASNWSSNAVPTSSDDVVIPSAPSNQPHVTLSPGTPAQCNNLTVESGATLTVDAGKALTVNGDTDNDGTIIVKADATGIGSLITAGAITGAGSFQMEQYMTGSGGATPDGLFYYVSSPIPNATAATYNVASGNKLWIDDEASQSYPQLTFGAIPLEVGQGYIARMGATGTTTFSGSSFNTGNITEGSLTRTGTSELNRGYNLVGNPYTSTVNWNTAAKTNLETSIWFRTHDGSGNMLFDTYNTTGNIGTNNNGNGDVTNLIPPTQAVWVRVNADGNTGQIDFDNADRSHGAWSGLYKTEAQEGLVRIALSDGNSSDEAIVMFDASAQDGFDDYDSHKFWAGNVPQLYMNVQEDTLVINGLFSTLTSPSIPLGVKLPFSGNFSLNASNITVIGESVHLEDTYLNIFQELNVEPNYAFTSDAGNIGDRFVLHFGMSVTGIEEVESSSYVFISNNQLNVILPQDMENGNVQIIDMAGRNVATETLNASRTVLDMNVNAGIYLVRVETSKVTDTHKVVLK